LILAITCAGCLARFAFSQNPLLERQKSGELHEDVHSEKLLGGGNSRMRVQKKEEHFMVFGVRSPWRGKQSAHPDRLTMINGLQNSEVFQLRFRISHKAPLSFMSGSTFVHLVTISGNFGIDDLYQQTKDAIDDRGKLTFLQVLLTNLIGPRAIQCKGEGSDARPSQSGRFAV
jgi:hypothetical protein